MVLVPWQSLGEKIRDVVAARDMLDAELVALDTVLQPMKPHVYAFRQARRDRPIGQAHGDLVIAKEECGGLRVAQVVQDGALDSARRAAAKRAAYSASCTEEQTTGIV